MDITSSNKDRLVLLAYHTSLITKFNQKQVRTNKRTRQLNIQTDLVNLLYNPKIKRQIDHYYIEKQKLTEMITEFKGNEHEYQAYLNLLKLYKKPFRRLVKFNKVRDPAKQVYIPVIERKCRVKSNIETQQEICRLYLNTDKITYKQLAQHYNICSSTVSFYINYWRHLYK